MKEIGIQEKSIDGGEEKGRNKTRRDSLSLTMKKFLGHRC